MGRGGNWVPEEDWYGARSRFGKVREMKTQCREARISKCCFVMKKMKCGHMRYEK